MESEMENGRHRDYNFAMDTLDHKYLLENLIVVFDCLKCAAQLKVAFGYMFKNVEDGSFRYYYAYENIALLERTKLVAATEHFQKIKNLLNETDVIESCTREQANTKWKHYQLTNVTLFAALLKNVPTSCKNSVLPNPQLKNQFVKCLTSEQNTRKPYNGILCLFRDLVLFLHGNERLVGETYEFFNLFLEKTGGIDPANFRGVCMEGIAAMEDIVQADIFWYDLDFVDGSMIWKLARWSVEKDSLSVQLLRFF